MNIKLLSSLLFACFPALALADGGMGTLNFAPPIGDYSVVFLGNIFGVVDGVLHGTGSQILGNMFGVFNAAVLALGGIVIMYTLLVATLNTAHEGEVLGSQWSSIWIPMRSTLGLALLIPKASGYCMMQIFIMWVIVQGVGAADKVWNAALGYLNRGGVIVQAQQTPETTNKNSTEVAQGASAILAGQVCMLGIQKILELQRQTYLAAKSTNAPPCGGSSTPTMALFCNNPVPNFINSVNMVAVQSAASQGTTTYSVNMPNFSTSGPESSYSQLTGICGTITWNSISALDTLGSLGQMLTPSQLETASMSRAIALQQMYMDLSTVAQVIVNNNPALTASSSVNTSSNAMSNLTPSQSTFSQVAQQQFGVPYLNTGGPCSGINQNCVSWGSATQTSDGSGSAYPGAPLFSGVEFQGAIEDYSNIMLPTLNLIAQAQDQNTAIAARQFIQTAETSGWMMAGSYFFNLVQLNGLAGAGSNETDSMTGLSNSTYDQLSTVFTANYCNDQSKYYPNFCTWLTGGVSTPNETSPGQALLQSVQSMVSGASLTGGPLVGNQLIPGSSIAVSHDLKEGPLSATAYGFIWNSMLVNLPGQPGLTAPAFSMHYNPSFSNAGMKLPTINFGCSSVKTFIFVFCLGGLLGDVFYNMIIVTVYNAVLIYIMQLANLIFQSFMIVPIMTIGSYFLEALKSIQEPTNNPIVSLGNMGVAYINEASALWLTEIFTAVGALMIPVFGIFMVAFMVMAMPLVAAWMGVMASIGFLTAYYIPILPYMIFTFGSIAWLMATIEAMVAAPLVALGVSNPEGHQAFGKAESSIMILMNVFLRPSLMIIGYIAAIAMSYVSIWVLNAGFSNAIQYIGASSGTVCGSSGCHSQATFSNPINYTDWASMYSLFFSVLIYTTTYVTLVQKSFTLISDLPDKVLRWIGGQPESRGAESAEWAGEVKSAVQKSGDETGKAQLAMQAKAQQATVDKMGPKGGGNMSAE